MLIVAVFDTNVLFSSTIWGGKPAQCVDLARQGLVHGLTCFTILQELEAVLKRKTNFTPAEVEDTINDLTAFLEIVPISGSLQVISEDARDNQVSSVQ